MNEKRLTSLLGMDLSAGTEQFKNKLLVQCLEVLGQEESKGFSLVDDEISDLSDDELEMLAAAGVVRDENTDDPWL